MLQGYILKCLISPDVQQLATASSDKTVKLWNVDGFSLDRTLTGTVRSRALLSLPAPAFTVLVQHLHMQAL